MTLPYVVYTLTAVLGLLAGALAFWVWLLQRRVADARRHASHCWQVIECSPLPIAIAGPEGRLQYVNARFTALTGYSLADLTDQPRWLEQAFPNPLTRRQVLESWNRLAKTGRPSDPARPTEPLEIEILCRDGSTRALEQFTASTGEAVLAAFHDLTDRKRADEALRASEHKYRELVENANSIILRWDRQGLIKFLNEFGQAFFGYREEEIVGKHVLDTIVPANESTGRDLRPLIDAICADPSKFERNINENVRRNGERVWIAWTNKTVLDAQGQVVEVFSVGTDITQRKRAQEALEDREAKLSSVLRAAPVGIGTAVDRRFVEVNDQVCQIAGYSAAELVGQPTRLLYATPEEFELVGQEYRLLGVEPGVRTLETRWQRKDGSLVDVQLHLSPIRPGDLTSGVTFVVLDITARKTAERALRMFEFTIEQAGDAIYWMDADGGFFYVNEQACRSLGYSRAELMALRVFDIDPDYPRERWHETWARYLRRELTGEKLETRHQRKDGTVFPVEVVAQHFWFGNTNLHVAFVRDITARKQAEEALRLSEERFAFAMDAVKDGLWDWDVPSGRAYFSPRYSTMLGYAPGELSSNYETWRGLLHPEDRDRTEREIRRDLASGASGYALEFRMRTKDGRWLWILGRAKVVERAPDGRPVRLVGTHADVTAAKESELALRASLEEKVALLKEVHHRVKNNLQIVSSLLSLRAGLLEDPQTQSALQETQSRVRSMALIHETLYRSGNLARVDLPAYVETLCTHLTSAYGNQAARIQLLKGVAPLGLEIDQAVPCGLLITELVSNALKHAFPNERCGRIWIELTPEPANCCTLTVADDGVGVPADLDLRQLPSLGLQLVFNLAGQLDGTVDVDRTRGLAFRIRFPAHTQRLLHPPSP